MHLPQAVQQCPSCYMYCMSRGPSSPAVPPVPPHARGPAPQLGHQEAAGGSPHRTQPRAVTLPHAQPCSHQDQMAGPRPQFGSLPHQQQSPKSCNSHHGTLQHLQPAPRAIAPANNIGLPEDSPPPLPPHGPPPLPPANLISKGHLRPELRDHYTSLQASYPPPGGSQAALYGNSASLIRAATCSDPPNRCPNPQALYNYQPAAEGRLPPPCIIQHMHGPRCNGVHPKGSHPHVPHPRSYPQGGAYPSHQNDPHTHPNFQNVPQSNSYPRPQSGIPHAAVNGDHSHQQRSSHSHQHTLCHPQQPPGDSHPPLHTQNGSKTLPHPQSGSHPAMYSQCGSHSKNIPHVHPQSGATVSNQQSVGSLSHLQNAGSVPHPLQQNSGLLLNQKSCGPKSHQQSCGPHPHPPQGSGPLPHPQSQGFGPLPLQCVGHPHSQSDSHIQSGSYPPPNQLAISHLHSKHHPPSGSRQYCPPTGSHPGQHQQGVSHPQGLRQPHQQDVPHPSCGSQLHPQPAPHPYSSSQVGPLNHSQNAVKQRPGGSLPPQPQVVDIKKKPTEGDPHALCHHQNCATSCPSEKKPLQYPQPTNAMPPDSGRLNGPHIHHPPHTLESDRRPSTKSGDERQGAYGIPPPRTNGVPPPPPMPPPPMVPQPMPCVPFKYDCLPHQHLIPPPQQEIVLGCPEHGHHHISSVAKVDRPYCGFGPSGRNRGVCVSLNKNQGQDATRLNHNRNHGSVTNGNHHHLGRRHQAVSQSAVMGSSRHGLAGRGVAADDCGSRNDRWRRNGGQREGQSYELSQDLADKRLEMLERRYGGDRARRAAVTIQRAYRHYAMHKKFRAITATAKAQEKRLSRRFTVDASCDWADSANGNGHPFDAEQRIRSEFDKLNRNLNATVYGDNRRPSRSLSMRDSARGTASPRIEIDNLNDTSLYCHSSHNTTVSPSSTPVVNGSDNHHSPHLSQSGDSNSYASSRELKYLTSEDSGFGSQEPVINKCTSSHRSKGSGRSAAKRVPPEVPRRTSSIKSESSGSADSFVAFSSSANHRVHCAPPSLTPPSSHSSRSSEGGSDGGVLRRSADNGSLSSVQSSGSDSSLSQSNSDRGTPSSNQDHQEPQEFAAPTSPVWKRKAQISEVLRKRQYRVGLNLFNKKPEKGVTYLIGRGFLENAPQAVAKFLLTRKGLSKQMIGEYLGNLQNQFNMSVLECFATEIDLSGVQVDVALRKFQTHFRMPGEAQKIERLMQVFAQRYCQCNRDVISKLHDPETIFVLAFAIIMLNTDLHTASLKPEKRMKIEDFVKNLRGIDDGFDIEREMLEGMYQRIKEQEFRPGHDHVTQVLKVQQTVVGKKPVLALPHRRLVCYCRLYEIPDPNKKERSGLHQREVFLFNDLLVVTKIFSKKKNSITYTFRESFPLAGLLIQVKEAIHYPYLLEVRQRVDNKVLIMLNARNEHDRTKFCEDLRESILEMDEMENLRIEGELERQKANLRASRPNSTAENRDSGVADMELITPGEKSCSLKPEASLKRTALSNSLLDIHEAGI